jgi:hypothetical protein
LELDGRTATATIEARTLADRVLRRDRLRLRILTGATIIFSVLSALAIYGFFHLITASIRPKVWESMDVMFKDKRITEIELATLRLLQDILTIQMESNLVASAAVATLLLAALCTVLLILATRRATFRKIQISLVVLSEQIDALRESLRNSHSAAGGEVPQKPNAG